MLRNLIFTRYMYPQFVEQLNLQLSQGKFILYFDISDKKLDFNIIADKTLVVFSKKVSEPIITNVRPLTDKISSKDINIDFIKLVKNLKKSGSIVDSQHLIDHIHQNLNNFFIYYKFSAQEIKYIYKFILEKWDAHFKNNPYPVIVNEDNINKWID